MEADPLLLDFVSMLHTYKLQSKAREDTQVFVHYGNYYCVIVYNLLLVPTRTVSPEGCESYRSCT
jgi:hypothetical protein